MWVSLEKRVISPPSFLLDNVPQSDFRSVEIHIIDCDKLTLTSHHSTTILKHTGNLQTYFKETWKLCFELFICFKRDVAIRGYEAHITVLIQVLIGAWRRKWSLTFQRHTPLPCQKGSLHSHKLWSSGSQPSEGTQKLRLRERETMDKFQLPRGHPWRALCREDNKVEIQTISRQANIVSRCSGLWNISIIEKTEVCVHSACCYATWAKVFGTQLLIKTEKQQSSHLIRDLWSKCHPGAWTRGETDTFVLFEGL